MMGGLWFGWIWGFALDFVGMAALWMVVGVFTTQTLIYGVVVWSAPLAWIGRPRGLGSVLMLFDLAFGLGWMADEPESLILAQSERWRHA